MTEKHILGFESAAHSEYASNEHSDACRIVNIFVNSAMILPNDLNPDRMEFSERTGDNK